MLTDWHLKLGLARGPVCRSIARPRFIFSPLHNIDVVYLSFHTRTTTIQPVQSSGCHSNRAPSLSILCPVSPHRLRFPGRRFRFCMQIKPPNRASMQRRGGGSEGHLMASCNGLVGKQEEVNTHLRVTWKRSMVVRVKYSNRDTVRVTGNEMASVYSTFDHSRVRRNKIPWHRLPQWMRYCANAFDPDMYC